MVQSLSKYVPSVLIFLELLHQPVIQSLTHDEISLLHQTYAYQPIFHVQQSFEHLIQNLIDYKQLAYSTVVDYLHQVYFQHILNDHWNL